MKKNTLIRSLLVASLAVLSACGGGDEEPLGCQDASCATPPSVIVPVAPPGVVPPASPNVSSDYILQNVIPMMQQQYGNISVQKEIRMMDGLTMGASSYSWATFYQTYMLGMITRSDCRINNPSGNNAMSPWGTLNYGCFQNQINPYASAMSAAYVQFANTGYNYYNFFEIMNWFVSAGASYAQSYYSNYGQGMNYYQPGYWNYRPNYCYDPYWNNTYNGYGNGGYSAPYYSSGGRFFINIGFSGQI